MRKLLIVSAIALTSVACADEHAHGETCPSDPPAIDSFSLSPATALPGDTINGMVEVSGFTLTGEAGGHAHEASIGPSPQSEDGGGEACPTGHVHVYMDDLMTNPVIQATTHMFSFEVPMDAPAGAHNFMGRLHGADHAILEPQVISEVTITVQ